MISTNKLIKENCMASINKESTDKAKQHLNTKYCRDIVNKVLRNREKQIDACVAIQDCIGIIASMYIDDYDGPGCPISELSWQIQCFIYHLRKHSLKNSLFDCVDIENCLSENKKFYDKLRKDSKYLNQANYDELASYMLGNAIDFDEVGPYTQHSKHISKRAVENCITFYELEHMQWNPAGINGRY